MSAPNIEPADDGFARFTLAIFLMSVWDRDRRRRFGDDAAGIEALVADWIARYQRHGCRGSRRRRDMDWLRLPVLATIEMNLPRYGWPPPERVINVGCALANDLVFGRTRFQRDIEPNE